jgi:hypothetical protein
MLLSKAIVAAAALASVVLLIPNAFAQQSSKQGMQKLRANQIDTDECPYWPGIGYVCALIRQPGREVVLTPEQYDYVKKRQNSKKSQKRLD